MAVEINSHRWIHNFPDNWKLMHLEDVCRIRRGASPRPVGDPRYFGGSVPWIKISDATAEQGRWLSNTKEFVTEAGRDKSLFLERGSLILSNSGTTGKPKFLDIDGCIHDGWLAFDDFKYVSPIFLFYLLVWHTDYLTHIADGSVQKNLNTGILKRLQVALPSLIEQNDIAHILGTLDDKIELNQQMNQNLEAIAQTVFKSWFVDFDPVRAKMEGYQPVGIDAETADLFPDSFEDSHLGEIPKEWEIKPLDEVANFLNGLALQKYPPTGNEYLPVIKIAELRKGVTESSGRASPNIDNRYTIADGEVLFSWSGSLEVCVWCGGKGALNQHLFKVTSADYPKWFYYQWLKYYLPNFQAIAASKATTMGHVQRHHLSEAQAVVPPADTLQIMDKTMAPLLNRVISNSIESHTLTAIRDTLLPKLLSGEIRVKDAEKLVEAAA